MDKPTKFFLFDSPQYIDDMEIGDIFIISKSKKDTEYADLYECVKATGNRLFRKLKVYSLKKLFETEKIEYYNTICDGTYLADEYQTKIIGGI